MRSRTSRGVVVLVVALAFSACSVEEPVAVPTQEGEEVYEQNCARCHQADGRGHEAAYPALAGNPIVTGEASVVTEIVVEGRGGMPAFGPRLDADELAQVITYIRTAWGNDASALTPSQAR